METNPPMGEATTVAARQILQSGELLLSLINQVLDLSQIEAGELQVSLEDVDPAIVIDECSQLIELLASARGLSFRGIDAAAEPPPLVRADPLRLKQVLLNLMMNAVKYNTTGDTVSVNCRMREDGSLRFEVSDDGPGIPKDRHAEIFTPFNRLGMHNHGIEGTGIGLSISKRLVDAMHGEIGIESAAGQGATFWFTLSTAGTGSRCRSSQTASLDVSKKEIMVGSTEPRNKILYIEDNPANTLLMEQIVKRLDRCDLVTAHTAEIGIAMARTETPHLVLMDINLPDMGGIEALRTLRRFDETASIPVIAVSAAAMDTDIKRAMDAGFDTYLTKPLNIRDTMETLNVTLARATKT